VLIIKTFVLMLYLALPPAPPPIIVTIPTQNASDESPTEKIPSVTKPTKPSIQDNGIASRATAQPSICTLPQTQLQPADRVNNLLREMLVKPEGKPVNCIPQKQKFGMLSLQEKLRKQKPARGFSPVSTVSTSDSNSLPKNRNLALDNQTTKKINSTNTNFEEILENQTPTNTLAFEKSTEKNAVNKILITLQELINLSLPVSLKNTIDNVIQADTQKSQTLVQALSEQTSTPQASTSETQASTVGSLTTTDKNNSINTASAQQSERQKLAYALNRINQKNAIGQILVAVQELINISLSGSLKNTTDNSQQIVSSTTQPTSTSQASTLEENTSHSTTEKDTVKRPIELARNPDEPFLVGVVVNGREIGTLDVIQDGTTLLIPLEKFAEITGFTVENADSDVQLKTPLGVIKLETASLKQINSVSYITNNALQKELKIGLELNTADLTLLVDLPWRGGSRQYRSSSEQLEPNFLAPNNGISSFRQELNLYRSNGDTDLNSSTILNGRILGFAYHLRLDNNFEDEPDINEYFLYKRSGRFRYQLGRQQVGLHPLINALDLTGLQFGYSNLPAEMFGTSYGANEILPRRSRPIQTFRGQVPPASFVQLRVGGVVIAQQQVGFNGQYEFLDINLPPSQSNEVEVIIFDRNNLRVPREIRSVRMNASDLLLPAGGNVQLAGVGVSGNLAQKSLFGESNFLDEGKLVGFYQLRQGLSNNLTFEGSVQAVPNAIQSQAGLIWRLANPVILSASVGNSYSKIGYSADLDIQLNRLQINANSQSLPEGYTTGKKNTERSNHSLEVNYRLNNRFNLGFIARSRQDEVDSTDYILPTFYARPLSNLSLSGRPDIDGRYLFNAFYQANNSTRLTFNTYGDAYISDLTYKFSRNYQLSFGNEFGGGLAPRYSVSIGNDPSSLRQLSWNAGLAYSNGDVGPLVGASMQVIPGLFARVDYQGIPSRGYSEGGLSDGRLLVSLVSDLSFAGGRIAPSNYSGVGKERGAIAGRLTVEGENKGFNLSGSLVRVYDKNNKNVGSTTTDSKGHFFVGNLPEGIYVVELEPEELPVELSLMQSSLVAQVANSVVTNLSFPIRPEFGVAGRITDISGQPVGKVRLELLNGAGARVITGVTDEFGLYRLDGVPVGLYTLRVSTQDSLNPNDSLPKREIQIRNQFVYDQNLQLPVSAAAKKKS
jgi:hypothetical protein